MAEVAEKTETVFDIARAAADELERPDVVERQEPTETEAQRADRVRDEQGRFAKTEAERAAKVEKPKDARPTLKLREGAAENAPAIVAAPTGETPAAVEKVGPPQAWGGLAKVKWDRLPVDVQKEIATRETEREKAVSDLLPVRELLDVNREFLVNEAGSLPGAVQQLVAFAKMSVEKPTDLILHIARAKGIDLAALVNGQRQPAQQQPQDIETIISRAVEQRLQPYVAQTEQQQNQQLLSTISQFAADPARPFFNDVRMDMGHLLKTGQAGSMEEAYEKATWANPTIRAHLLQQTTEAAEAQRKVAADKARQAAGASLRGSPLPNGTTGGKPSSSSVHDAVRAAFAEAEGA
ncbi:hypothetical protein UFOVP833_63 [uncultured Caudovirales phage]|uniref:Uncharacterized protein n=1 Tax=uncultured Caudovirales phage TaxID=2100421 RepID=A0A6J5SSU6_9CAUD|nr:hypothetical protein UFOVP833_63 [uncultured Caudovirales phage]CAB4218310.1 hypothetical protein UFOVP1603_25 [uncultured Caudovirales phage]